MYVRFFIQRDRRTGSLKKYCTNFGSKVCAIFYQIWLDKVCDICLTFKLGALRPHARRQKLAAAIDQFWKNHLVFKKVYIIDLF